MKPLRFWIPTNGYRFTIPSEFVESDLMPSAEHEAGHIVAAYHAHARVVGIAVGFRATDNEKAMFLVALYKFKKASLETRCVTKAAGSAADILFHGKLGDKGARGDLQDIEALTGQASLEPFLGQAKDILGRHKSEVICIADALRRSLGKEQELALEKLPGGDMGTTLLSEAQLMDCLSPGRDHDCG